MPLALRRFQRTYFPYPPSYTQQPCSLVVDLFVVQSAAQLDAQAGCVDIHIVHVHVIWSLTQISPFASMCLYMGVSRPRGVRSVV